VLAALVQLVGCKQPAANVHMASDSPDAASSKSTSGSPDSAEPSPALLQNLAYWETATTAIPKPEFSISGWHPHAGSGACMPLSYGDFTLAKVAEHGPNDESVTLTSEVRGATVSLFVYPATSELAAEFETVRGHMNQSCGSGVGATLDIDDARFPGGGKVGLCTRIIDGDFELVEEVVLFTRDGWHYKVRATWPAFLSSAAFEPTREIIAVAFNPCQAS
jgi:hypothetical protein